MERITSPDMAQISFFSLSGSGHGRKEGKDGGITMEKRRMQFCIECRKESGYFLRRKEITKTIRDKEYTFDVTTAVCVEKK